MSKMAPEIIVIAQGEVKVIDFNFTEDLGANDTTGLPIVIEVGSSDLTFSDEAASGKLSQVKVVGVLTDKQYELKCTQADDGTPAQTHIGEGRIHGC